MKPRYLSLFLSLRYRITPTIKLTNPAINNITPKTRPPKLVRSTSPFSFRMASCQRIDKLWRYHLDQIDTENSYLPVEFGFIVEK